MIVGERITREKGKQLPEKRGKALNQ